MYSKKMERNKSVYQSNLYQYKNHLSPFGQKVLNVLLNNWNRENHSNNYRLHNRFNKERRYMQKKKVITFQDSRNSRPTIFNQNRLQDGNSLYNNSTHVRDGINDTDDFSCLLQLKSQNYDREDNLNTQMLLSESLQINSNEDTTNLSSVNVSKLNTVSNNEKGQATSSESLDFDFEQTDSKRKQVQNNVIENNINLTATDLLRYNQMQNNTVKETPGVRNLDLLMPLDGSNNPEKVVPEYLNEDMFIFDSCTRIDARLVDRSKISDIGKDVSWNEMFDTELLPEIIEPTVNKKIIAEQNTLITDEKAIINQITKSAIVGSKLTHKRKVGKNKAEKLTTAKPQKRKKDMMSTKERAPKKIKESNLKQNRLKKGKCIKTIEKWLDGVDPNVSVDAEKSEIINPIDSETTNKTLDEIVKSTLVPKKQDGPKKIVQAQLKNKGGIMKFSKPKVSHEGKCDVPKEETSSAAVAVENKNKATAKINVKKSKPKFIAPLKSQIPLKEIEFAVVSVDESNWIEHFLKLEKCNSTDLYAVLIYSNGFCQLNEQFTEDDCIPEGVMLLIGEEFYSFNKTEDKFSDIIIKFLEKKAIICHDGKNILIFFKHHFELEVDLVIHDVKIGASLLEPDNPPESFSDLQKLMSTTPDYRVATECKLQKAAWYLTLLRDAADILKTKLLEQSLWRLFEDIEMKVLPIIADMEFRGILVDTEKLKSMEGILLSRMKTVESQCHRAAGKAFQMTSPAQVAAILYDELQLHTKCNLVVKETSSKGAKSTSEDMLRTLVPLHPLPGLILEYRRLHKAHATFLAGIAHHVKDGVIRPVWVQTAAATGRIAANNPNVQAIPKAPFSLSADVDNPEEELNLRSVYLARPGYLLLGADFKQVECRVFASTAADTVLLAALRSGGDLFTALAAEWLNKPSSEVSAADRERTKRLVYARLYGAGVRKLRDILGGNERQAAAVLASFDSTFPSLRSFGSSAARCWAGGVAPRSAAGRVRPLPALCGADDAARHHAQRQALNFIVQGTAADICKIAMSRAHAQLRAAGVRARLLLQIHDELVWEVLPDQLHEAHAIIKSCMESSGDAAGLPALPVAAAAGRSWGDLEPLV